MIFSFRSARTRRHDTRQSSKSRDVFYSNKAHAASAVASCGSHISRAPYATRHARFENLEPRLNLTSIPALSSWPSANHTIYLDFDGHVTEDTCFNNGQSFYSPAYSEDSSVSEFSAEIATISEAFDRVAEDFAPFDVNVTTVEPPLGDLKLSGPGDTRWGVRVVITSDMPFSTDCGGLAVIDSFNSSVDTPAFVVSANGFGLGDSISHQVGHALGLTDDGTSAVANYEGHGSGITSWAPIMGSGYTSNVTQWDNGEYFDSNNAGLGANGGKGWDDLAIITGYNGFGYRPDLGGQSPMTSVILSWSNSNLYGFGSIETTDDIDFFHFATNGGPVLLEISPAAVGANLDILAKLYDSAGYLAGNLIATANDPSTLNATINVALPAGLYILTVEGVGVGVPSGNLPTGYTAYGSLGHYTITGTLNYPTYSQIVGIQAISGHQTEGDIGGKVFKFRAQREEYDIDFGSIAVVGWSVSGTGPFPASAEDFGGVFPSGLSVFEFGQEYTDILIYLHGDFDIEPNERFKVTLVSSTSYMGLVYERIGTIIDDDTVIFSIYSSSFAVTEGTGPSPTILPFSIIRTGGLATTASVQYSMAGSGLFPTNSLDFVMGFETSDILQFIPGQTVYDFEIEIVADNIRECKEQFEVSLFNPIGGVIGTSSSAIIAIKNDDLFRGQVSRKCDIVPRFGIGRRDNDESGDNNNTYDGAPAEMIAGLGTDGDWEFGDDYRAEDDAPQIGGVIATSDPLWMFVPPTYLAREQPLMPGTKSFDAASYFGGPPHGLKDDRKYEPDHGDDRWRELSFAELDRDRRESSDPHTLIDDALADWVAV